MGSECPPYACYGLLASRAPAKDDLAEWADWAARCCRAILVFALCEFVNLAGFAILLVLCGLLFVYTMGQPENSRMAVALAV